jgi:hypothetical protein
LESLTLLLLFIYLFTKTTKMGAPLPYGIPPEAPDQPKEIIKNYLLTNLVVRR